MTSEKDKFIEALRKTPNVSAAARAIKMSRKTVYLWRKEDAEFAAAWEDAIEEAVDDLEAKAWKRATTISDTLMIFLLKAHRPDKYRERFEHSGPGGGAIPIEVQGVNYRQQLAPVAPDEA